MASGTNSKYQQLEQEFQKFSHEDKKTKIINIMEYIKDKVNFAEGMGKFISKSPDISDEFLDKMYQLVMKTAVDTAQQVKDQQSIDMLDHIQQMIMNHQKLDEKEHQDADGLLNQI